MISHRDDEAGSFRKDVGQRTDGGTDHRNAGSEGLDAATGSPSKSEQITPTSKAAGSLFASGRSPAQIIAPSSPRPAAVSTKAARRGPSPTTQTVSRARRRAVAPQRGTGPRAPSPRGGGRDPHDEGSRVEPELGTGLLTGQRRIEPDAVGITSTSPRGTPSS